MEPRPGRVVIVGAGAAGVMCAYRLRQRFGPTCDLTLLEARDRIGGNAHTIELEFGGRPWSIDTGAQFFSPRPQPTYVRLLDELGLFDEGHIHARATGLSIWDADADESLLWLPGAARDYARFRPRDWARLTQFMTFVAYAAALERDASAAWTLSIEDWLPRLRLVPRAFRERVLPAFFYQFVSLPRERIGEASARYTVAYFIRNIIRITDAPEPGLRDPYVRATATAYQSSIGLDGVMQRALERAAIQPRLGEPVHALRAGHGAPLEVVTARGTYAADHVIFACPPPVTAKLLGASEVPSAALVDALRGLEYVRLPIAIQAGGSAYMPSRARNCEATNILSSRDRFSFTVWFGLMRDRLEGGEPIPAYKTWASTAIEPSSEIVHTLDHDILLPTTTFMAHRAEIARRQGERGLWFAGGWTQWFDSQEAALLSAECIVEGLERSAAPVANRAAQPAAPPTEQGTAAQLERWIARVIDLAPPALAPALRRSVAEVEARG